MFISFPFDYIEVLCLVKEQKQGLTQVCEELQSELVKKKEYLAPIQSDVIKKEEKVEGLDKDCETSKHSFYSL